MSSRDAIKAVWGQASNRLVHCILFACEAGEVSDVSLETVAAKGARFWARSPGCGKRSIDEMGKILTSAGIPFPSWTSEKSKSNRVTFVFSADPELVGKIRDSAIANRCSFADEATRRMVQSFDAPNVNPGPPEVFCAQVKRFNIGPQAARALDLAAHEQWRRADLS